MSSYTNTSHTRRHTLHVAQTGSSWTGQKLDEATGSVVARSYVTNLRKGRKDNPGYEKMRAIAPIARAMGFAPALSFEDAPGDGTLPAPEDAGA